MTNIIADIAGQYKSFLKLIDKMPDGDVISVGDMVDRGPDSKAVLEWFMKHGKAILGNHEHMMLDTLRDNGYYPTGLWLSNGGGATLNSFTKEGEGTVVPGDVLDWLESLPLYREVDGNLISHAFIHPNMSLGESCQMESSIWTVGESRIIWNRMEPVRRPEYKLQICGHNSQFGLHRWEDDEGEFAICLDDCRKRMLTGLHLPTMKIYQQEYI